jgi:methyl-accepting chemotaxis protein
VFRTSMIETERMAAADAVEHNLRARRSLKLDEVTKSFQGKIAELVAAFSAAAHEMRDSAGTMSASAELTTQQSAIVSNASDQTTANVQTVAAATEELSASIQQIGNEVAESAKIAAKAVGGYQTDGCGGANVDGGRAENWRGRDADPEHRDANQPAGVERDDRGGAGG